MKNNNEIHFRITSKLLTLAQITSKMGTNPDLSSSHDIGSRNYQGDVNQDSHWCIINEGSDDDTAPEILFERLWPIVESSGPFKQPSWPEDTKALFEIISYHEGPASCIRLDPEILLKIGELNCLLDIYVYWSTFNSTD